MKDCRECNHSCTGYGQLLCQERQPVMAAAWRRDPRNECGENAKNFKPKEEKPK